jgi:hypothetical protein
VTRDPKYRFGTSATNKVWRNVAATPSRPIQFIANNIWLKSITAMIIYDVCRVIMGV